MANSYMDPVRVFDNLYFVGTTWVSSWAVRTSGGIVLIDALDNDQEAHDSIEGGLRKLGLDPAEIRYVLITHAHGDHYGGANYLVRKYHARVFLSEIDWRELEKSSLEFDTPLWGRPPRRDGIVKDGERLSLGDTTIEVYATPGHTPGALSFAFPVSDHGQPHRALLWGGFGINAGPIASRFRSFVESTRRAQTLVRDEHIDVLIANHPSIDDSPTKMKELAQRPPGGRHSYVIGEQAVGRFLAVAGECTAAALASFDASAAPP